MTSEGSKIQWNGAMITSFLGVKIGAWLIGWLSQVNADWLGDFGDPTSLRSYLIGLIGALSALLAGKGTQAGSIGGKVAAKREAKQDQKTAASLSRLNGDDH